MLVKCISKTMRYGGFVDNLVLRSSSGLVFSVTPEQLYNAIRYGEIKLANIKIEKVEGEFKYTDIEPCNLTREEMNDDKLYVWNFLEIINRLTTEKKMEIVEYIKSIGYGMDEEDLISLIAESNEWYPSRFWSSDTMFRERALNLLEKYEIAK